MGNCYCCGGSDLLVRVKLVEFKHHTTRRKLWICEDCLNREMAVQIVE